jgi:hypothetical protein
MLGEVVLGLESRLREFERSHKVIRLDHAFSALSSDVMCRLRLAKSSDKDCRSEFLDDAKFSPD